MLEELRGHEETIRSRRPAGSSETTGNSHMNWQDRLNAQHSFRNGSEPFVIIIG